MKDKTNPILMVLGLSMFCGFAGIAAGQTGDWHLSLMV